MKVKLIVVRGKPEGKEIPLSGTKFKIGRGETCHLRPNSEQVSREHAEFNINNGVVTVADLGSRNGTLVNGKALTEGPCVLKDRDLVQVGPLTFAVSIERVPGAAAATPAAPKPVEAAAAPVPKAPGKPARSAPEDVLNEDIDAWLVGEPGGSNPEVPTTVYGGETLTIAAFKDNPETPAAPKPTPVPSAKVEDDEEEEEEEDEDEDEDEEEEEEDEELEDTLEDEEEDEDEEDEEGQPAEEFVDESNPFYAAKKAQQQATKAPPPGSGGANQQFKDTSDAAGEILRKLMEKRRASK
ncbi:FHA domain-containing protein [Paludisphaera rhizosphaerae]|uniref:FHA domain-containing protein n=1 Tax=Paludisphaera rhizosphaerae TaxID=2711216 RepID=UPI00197F9C03|nr:FHA domain-containing protein [Paludisphaera rhizosphaerae]